MTKGQARNSVHGANCAVNRPLQPSVYTQTCMFIFIQQESMNKVTSVLSSLTQAFLGM